MAPILSVRNLSTGYGKKQVLFDVNLDVMPGEIVLITGGNGSGKSTLLNAIYGLLLPWNGNARIAFRPNPDGPLLSTQSPARNLANGLAYVPQKNTVFDDLTVAENLLLASQRLQDRHTFSVRREEALTLLPALRLLLNRRLEKMSGGERQMVALAMLLLHRPKLMLLDEPLAGLSERLAATVVDLLREIGANNSVTLVIVDHRVQELASIATQRLKMQDGKINCMQDKISL